MTPASSIVGVVAENAAEASSGTLSLPGGPEPAAARSSSRSTVADLPDRIEAWSALDRLVWQDVDAIDALSSEQLDRAARLAGPRRPARDRRRDRRDRRARPGSRTTSCRTARPRPSTSRRPR